MKDNEVLVFSKLMDSKSLFLTANADTVYFVGIIDLSQGPMVFEAAIARGDRVLELGCGTGGFCRTMT